MDDGFFEVHRFVIIASSGLCPDYAANVFGSICGIIQNHRDEYVSIEETMQKLNTDLETYEQYFRGKYPSKADDILRCANPESLAALDEIIRGYNSLPPEKKLEWKQWYEKCSDIIGRIEQDD